jgi:rhodanese-related sulfurtransferase
MRTLGSWILIMLLLVAALVGCRAGGPASSTAPATEELQTQRVPVEGGGSYTDVSADGLQAMLANKGFLLINVHIPYEGELPDTDLFIPYNEVEANLDKLPVDKASRLVLYCRSGGMSAIAARTLVRLGYGDVWNLDGGMIAWQAAGYPLIKAPGSGGGG